VTVIVTTPVWLWNSEKGSWHFASISGEAAAEIRLLSLGNRGDFGSVKVLAKIGDTRWRTSVFPDKKSGGYVLPIKAEVRRREAVIAEQEVTIELDVV
jgi:Domain of unknown function (DUF1905)